MPASNDLQERRSFGQVRASRRGKTAVGEEAANAAEFNANEEAPGFSECAQRFIPGFVATQTGPVSGEDIVLAAKQAGIKPRSYSEVYNDLSGELVNLFRVARDDGQRLAIACELTPFARTEFAGSYTPDGDPLEQARRTLVRSFMGFGSNSLFQKSGFRANSNRSGTTPAHDWMNYPDALRQTIQRLRGVVIEHRDALDCMAHHDSPATLHYADPPYVMDTRTDSKADYLHEMSDTGHAGLAERLKQLKGMVVISGYRCDLYDRLYAGWARIDRPAYADGARHRVESLWFSPSAARVDLFWQEDA
jgi:DNA adenine methylase